MKWYDYIACYYCANMIVAGLMSTSLFLLTLGIFMYIMYENVRKNEYK